MDQEPLCNKFDDPKSNLESKLFLAQKQVTKTRFRLVLAGLVLGMLGFAGISYFGLPAAGTVSQPQAPASHSLTFLTFMKKLSERMLSADHSFNSEGSFVYSEVGKPVPDAMSFTWNFKKPGVIAKGHTIQVISKYKAKPGKGAVLKAALETILGLEETKEMETATGVSKVTSTVTGDVVVTTASIPIHPSEKEMQAERLMKAGMIKDKNPKYQMELAFGHTLDQMIESPGKNILDAVGGVKMSESIGLALEAIQGGVDMAQAQLINSETRLLQPYIKLLRYLAKIKSDTHIFYKAGTHDQLPLPKVGKVMEKIKEAMNAKFNAADTPPKVKTAWLDIRDSADGIDEYLVTGIPGSFWDMHVTFKNFKPYKFLSSLLDETK